MTVKKTKKNERDGEPIPRKSTGFSSDDCQCLLDIIDRLVADNVSRRDGKTIGMFLTSDEERSSYAKLRKAGEFYVPGDANELAERKAGEALSGAELSGADALLAIAHLLADETHGNYSAEALLGNSGLLDDWDLVMRLKRKPNIGG